MPPTHCDHLDQLGHFEFLSCNAAVATAHRYTEISHVIRALDDCEGFHYISAHSSAGWRVTASRPI